jgi:hypothetical protein
MLTIPTRFTALLTLLALSAVGLATVVIHADVAKLTRLSDAIVDGIVDAKATTLGKADGSIWTTYRVRVSETLAGTARDTVTIHVPGGEVAGLTREVSGVARLEKGQRAVLFLSQEGQRLLVLGEAQGCWRVTRDAQSGEFVAQNDLQGLALVDETGGRVAARSLRLPLADLRTKIAATLSDKAEEERLRAESEARHLAKLLKRAERHAKLMRGKPGGGE